jgi:hypothetical protein
MVNTLGFNPQTGDRVRVDGTAGAVELVEAS